MGGRASAATPVSGYFTTVIVFSTGDRSMQMSFMRELSRITVFKITPEDALRAFLLRALKGFLLKIPEGNVSSVTIDNISSDYLNGALAFFIETSDPSQPLPRPLVMMWTKSSAACVLSDALTKTLQQDPLGELDTVMHSRVILSEAVNTDFSVDDFLDPEHVRWMKRNRIARSPPPLDEQTLRGMKPLSEDDLLNNDRLAGGCKVCSDESPGGSVINSSTENSESLSEVESSLFVLARCASDRSKNTGTPSAASLFSLPTPPIPSILNQPHANLTLPPVEEPPKKKGPKRIRVRVIRAEPVVLSSQPCLEVPEQAALLETPCAPVFTEQQTTLSKSSPPPLSLDDSNNTPAAPLSDSISLNPPPAPEPIPGSVSVSPAVPFSTKSQQPTFDGLEHGVDYLLTRESRYRPTRHCMRTQTNVTPRMRFILVDWMWAVGWELHDTRKTLALSINYLDRFLETNFIARSRFQAVATACMLIAHKYEEVQAPDIRDYINICDRAVSRESLLDLEQLVCEKLNFNFTVVTMWDFVEILLEQIEGVGSEQKRRADQSPRQRLVEYMTNVSQFAVDTLATLPSLAAAASFYTALIVYPHTEWPVERVCEFFKQDADAVRMQACTLIGVSKFSEPYTSQSSDKMYSYKRFGSLIKTLHDVETSNALHKQLLEDAKNCLLTRTSFNEA